MPTRVMATIHISITCRRHRRVLVREFGGTLFTIAKDVKFQIEFNPAKIRFLQAYRI
ncbi:MAG: DUF3520 domain-containing protein [Marinilabiliales bacterium]|nr:DUF3520 domain-containing protein [Marinilabiliales bacterium]